MSISRFVEWLSRKAGWLVFGFLLLTARHLQAQATGPGYALHFNGSSSYVGIPGFGNFAPTNEITIEFWQRVSAVKSQSTFSLNPDQSTNRINGHVPWSDGIVYWDFGNANAGGRLAYSPPVSIVGTWQHFALVASQSGNFMYIYRNGVLEAQKTNMSPFVRGAYDLGLGVLFSGQNYFGGDLDEMRIWNVARSASQIQSNMNRSLVGNEPGLVAYWRFDEGAGATTVDSSGHGLTGNLLNAPGWFPSSAPILVPVATTLAVSNITTNGAVLNALVSADDSDTIASFQYGTSTNYSASTPPVLVAATNFAPVLVSNQITGLISGTIYHYRVIASNSYGSSFGNDLVFTPPFTPIATTTAASNVTFNSALLNGNVNPAGGDSTAWFQYGTSTNYGGVTSTFSIAGTNTGAVNVSLGASNLTGGTLYHCRLVASNSVGIGLGNDATFTTLPSPNDQLASLAYSGGPLYYNFAPGFTNYNAGVSSNVSSITVTPTLADPNASVAVQINGGSYVGVASGNGSPPLAVIPGFNAVNLLVTAQDGISKLTYTITVGVSGPNIAVVTTNANGPGSLAAAIVLANYCPGAHLITLASNMVCSCTVTDNFWYGPNALPPIASDITIEGNGSVIQRVVSNRLRFFYVGADPNNPATYTYNSPGAGKLTLRHLTLTNGLAQGGTGGGGGAGMGGAIFNQGILVLDSVTLVGNAALGGNGGDNGGRDYSSLGGGGGGGLGQDGGDASSGGFGGSVTPSGSQGSVGGTSGGGGGGFGVSDSGNGKFGGGVDNGLGGDVDNGTGHAGNGSGAGLAFHNGGAGGAFGFGGALGGHYACNCEGGDLYGDNGGGGGVGGGGGGGGGFEVITIGGNNGGNGGGGGFGGGGVRDIPTPMEQAAMAASVEAVAMQSTGPLSQMEVSVEAPQDPAALVAAVVGAQGWEAQSSIITVQ